MKKILAFIALCLLPSQIQAKEYTREDFKRHEIMFQTLSIIDAIETIDCLNRNVCEEANPIYGRRPSTGKIIGIKIASGIIHYVIADKIFDHDPKAARIFQLASIGIQGGAVVANLRFIF